MQSSLKKSGYGLLFAALLTLSVLLPLCLHPATAAGASLEDVAGSMIMAGFRGQTLDDDAPILEALRSRQVGHVILFDKDITTGTARNIASPEQVRALTARLREAAPGPLFIAVDQEGGMVRRLKPERGFMGMPAAKTLGRGKPENTAILARRMALELADLGINVDFAPVVDLDNPNSPIIGKLNRSFSADPATVSKHALAFGQALQDEGVIPVLKHFPGHGSSSSDSHRGLADISATWSSQADLRPYVDAIRAGWKGMIMVGHLSHKRLDPMHPASLSKIIVHDLLRLTLHWEGVVISDDLQMRAITSRYSLEDTILLAVNAGVDILLFGNNVSWDPDLPAKVHTTLVRLVKEGKIPRERLAESWRRINRLHDAYTADGTGIQLDTLMDN